MKKKIVAKFFNLVASLLLVGQTLTPALPLLVSPSYIYAQEADASPTPQDSSSPEPSQSPEISPSSAPEPTPADSDQVQVSPSPEAPLPSSEPSALPSSGPSENDQSNSQDTGNGSNDNKAPPTPESETLEYSSSAQLAPSVWQTGSDGKVTTTDIVVLGQTYSAPQNDKVKIIFTKLPDASDKLTVGEVKLSADQQEELSAVTDTAYEFTSPMADGTFEYDLTLPLPSNVNKDDVVVKSAESTGELGSAQTLAEPKEVVDETITIKGLTHFTVFVLVNDVDTDNPDNLGDSDDIANGVLTAIDDTWVDQNNADANKGSGDELHVRSKEDQNKRTFVKFDTSAIPAGSEITKATLRLFMFDAPPASRDYEARLLVEGWDEDTLTWNSQPVDAGFATDTRSTGTSNNVWREWNVTGDVQAFVNGELSNYGWVIRDSEENSGNAQLGKFRSSDQGNELRRPQLVVDFAAPDDQPTDYKSPTAQEATDGGDGDGFETDPTDAFSDGSGSAENENGAGDRHIFYNYNPFEIPDGSTIRGIEVRTDWRLDSTGGTNSLDVELSWDGGASWTDAKSDITETDKEHIASLGGADDTWEVEGGERTWVPAEFSNENFRVRVTMNSTNSGRDFFLDWIPVRVYYTPDTTAPTSEISSPTENSFWNSSIEISGSSTDIPNTTVDYVKFYYRTSGEEENPWTEIPDSQQNNGNEFDPFNWSFNWTPPVEGSFDIKAEATDKAGNMENSPVVEYVTYDVTGPEVSTPSASPDPTNHPPQILADAVDALSNIASAIFSVDDPDFIFAKPLEALDGFFDSLAETLFGPEFDNGMVYPGEGLHTLYVGAYDAAGNFGSNSGPFTVDTFAPTSEFFSPGEGSFWSEPIAISGSSDDESDDTVDFVQLFYRTHQDENGDDIDGGDGDGGGDRDGDGDGNPWIEIDTNDEEEGTQPLRNTEGGNPFNWNFNWTPSEENSFDIKAEATDTAGNVEGSPVVSDVTYDVTDPESDITFPDEDASYTEEEWNEENAQIRGTAEDSPSSGVNSVLISIQRDLDDKYWNGRGWSTGEGDGEILNNANFDGDDGTWDFDFEFIEPGGADEGYIVRSHARDNAGNQEDTTEVHFFFSHGLPIISGEGTVNVGSAQVTFVWTTDILATSRVVYDTVSHPDPLGEAPNYGYANSTGEYDTDPKVTSHTVVVCCFDQSTTYYYRVISQGSPEVASGEKSFTTPATPPQSINPNSQGPGITTPGPAGPGPGAPSTTVAGAVAGAVTGLGQVLGVGTGEEVLGEATAEATPTVSPSPSPTAGEPEEAEEAKAFWQNWWWLILLILLGAGAFWWYSKKSKE